MYINPKILASFYKKYTPYPCNYFLWKWGSKNCSTNEYRIRRCPVPPPLTSPPVSLGKSWSLTISLKKIYIENFRIRNYFKKDFLNFSFHYVRYCNHLVTFFEKKFLISLLLQALNQVSQSNILHFTSDHLKSIAFSSL